MINRRRIVRSPRFERAPSFCLPPVDFCNGVSPSQAAKWRPAGNPPRPRARAKGRFHRRPTYNYSANFSDADLRKAKYECGAIESTKELSRASRSFSDFLDMEEPTICTQLQGAIFFDAKLQAASFIGAQLQRATSILRSCSMPTSWVRSYTRPTWQWRSCGVPTTPTTCAGAASFQI